MAMESVGERVQWIARHSGTARDGGRAALVMIVFSLRKSCLGGRGGTGCRFHTEVSTCTSWRLGDAPL
jgi:hypothetical protein